MTPELIKSARLSEPEVKGEREEDRDRDNVMCFYCKKKGHIAATCPVLKKRNSKPVALVNKIEEAEDSRVQ